MEIRRITAQKLSLEAFYQELAALNKDNDLSNVAMMMLNLLTHLQELNGPSVWAVTSHARLCLISGDDYRLPMLVGIACDGQWFQLECRMPQDKAPWPDAYITGRTRDVAGAAEMILFGLREVLPVGTSI